MSIMRSLRTGALARTRRRIRPRYRLTARPRKLSAAECRAVEERLRAEGILPRANERI
jgi:hypothetical protein